ncbi:MAG: gamma-glutamyltransferase [Synechococcaceae cyanobacterium]|nr:gamma-glutamyltransferase [Synechococcaceae cyanobacterium]
MRASRRVRVSALSLVLLLPVPFVPQAAIADVLLERDQRFHPVWSARGMVAVQEPHAAAAGAAMLRAGGNAVDAAVASSFALAVTHPQAGNLGGGGFLLLWLPGPSPAASRGCLPRRRDGAAGDGPELRIGRGTAVAVNFRETAPMAATAGMFLDAEGLVDRRRATHSLLSTGVPGSVAGLTLVQRCYGKLPLARVLAPAITLAERGFPVSPALSGLLGASLPRLAADPASRLLFLRPEPSDPTGFRALRPGQTLRQPALAATLRRIAAAGAPGFYRGPTADALVRLMRSRGGLIRRDDLERYRARLVRPLAGRFRGHTVLTQPPPSSGLTLLQMLAILEPFDLSASGAGSAATLHLLAETMNLAYRDRNAFLGDPDQLRVPVRKLLDARRIATLRDSIDLRRHRPAAQVDGQAPLLREGENTVHLSVADRQGGLVATTTTLNFPFGNGITVPEAGFLLNNEMDDFAASPGRPNAYGLVQGAANAIAPGRRPLSSMSPTLVFRPGGEPWIATGSPGGSRILTTVLQVVLNRIVHGLNLAGAVAAPRVHSQLWPDRLGLEEGISPDTRRLLEAMGHALQPTAAMGAANSVEVTPGGTLGVVDPRRAEGPALPE